MVREGYKQTEIGVIPEDWSVKSLGEIASFTNGKAHENDIKEYGQYIVVNSKFISSEAEVKKYSDKCHCATSKNNILMVMSDIPNGKAIAKCFFVDSNNTYTINQRICSLEITKANPKFIFYRLSRNPFYLQFDDGVKQTNLRRDEVLACPLPIPRLEEQRSIAQALSDVDALIAALDKAIAKKRHLKTATMQQLLTGKKRLPGFGEGKGYQKTEVGAIPEDWVLTPLEKISAFITKGSTPTTYGFSWVQDGILFLRSECVSENGLDLSQSMFISRRAHTVLSRSELRSGDILITITGNVGRVVHLGDDFGIGNMNQHIARVRITSDSVNSGFVHHFLTQSSVRKSFNTITTGQAYPQISLKQVRDTVVPLPSLPEQHAIATVLSDMDTEIAALETRLAKTQALKQGMMQQLLTGKVRLI